MEQSWRLSAIGAFDRFNYGDVLLAKIAEANLARAFPGRTVDFYALRASDLTAEGGVRTKPLSALYDWTPAAQEQHLMMLAGGALLQPSWALMVEHLMPKNANRLMSAVYKRTGRARWERLWRRIYGCPNLQPWTIDPLDFKAPDRAHVAYNAVGGTSVKSLSDDQLKWQTSALARAAWLTVRDRPTAETIQARGLPLPEVAPDSGVVMKRLLPPLQAGSLRAEILARSGLPDRPYLCVQAAEIWSRNQEQPIADQLRKVHAATGLQVLSFAIGRASGHDDQVTSDRLKACLSDAPWFATAPTDLTVNEIMALIAGSACYLGTSLHGFITAFAFGRPRVGMMAKVTKLVAFRTTWDIPDMPAGIDFASIGESVRKAMSYDPGDLSLQAERVERIHDDSFDRMVAAVRQRAASSSRSADAP